MPFRPNAFRSAASSPFRGGASGVVVLPAATQRQIAGLEMFFTESILVSAKKMDRLGGMLKDFRVPLRRSLRQVIIPSIQQNFIKGGRPRWEPLAESTIRQKNGNARPLRRTDNLMRTMSESRIWKINRERVVLDDLPQSVWYGKVHQNGLDRTTIIRGALNPLTGRRGPDISEQSPGGIPARPFITLQDSDLPEIDRIFAEWVDEQIAKAGLA